MKKKEKEKEQEREQLKKDLHSIQINEKIEKLKHKRIVGEVTGKSLGEELMEEENAQNWVKKSREVQIEREKELAKKREQMLNDMDKTYTSKNLSGLKVGHKLDDIGIGTQPIILTLADQNILKDADNLNDEPDELVNIDLTEHEKWKKMQEAKKKKPRYSDDYEFGKQKSLLPQYDEEAPKESFTLDEEGSILNSQDRLESVRRKLQEIPGKELYSLDIDKSTANEYYTEQEMIQFKKTKVVKKKKKIRKKTTESDVTPMEEEMTASKSLDHGSRSRSTKLEKDEKKAEEEQEKRDTGYAKALQKAADQTKFLFSPDEDDEELLSSVARARSQSITKEGSISSIAERVRSTSRSTKEVNKSEDGLLIFIPTTEFIRSVHPIEISSIPVVKKRENKEEVEAAIQSERAEHEEMIHKAAKARIKKEQEEKEKMIKENEEEQSKMDIKQNGEALDDEIKPMEEDGEKELEADSNIEEFQDRPSNSVGSVLSMLRKKGIRSSDMETLLGRPNDEEIKPNDGTNIRLEYLDEFGRTLTPKEAFRQLSHKFHGKKPGKNKIERRMRKFLEEKKRKEASLNETPLQAAKAMHHELQKSQSPFILLGGSSSQASNSNIAPFNDSEVKEVNLRKGGKVVEVKQEKKKEKK